jgi:hypothetical protein
MQFRASGTDSPTQSIILLDERVPSHKMCRWHDMSREGTMMTALAARVSRLKIHKHLSAAMIMDIASAASKRRCSSRRALRAARPSQRTLPLRLP